MAASTAVAFLESALYPRPHMKAGPRSPAQGPPTHLWQPYLAYKLPKGCVACTTTKGRV